MSVPASCDTFVAMPPATANGCVVFGKNADRPSSEVQEVILVPGADHKKGAKLQCTYIEIDQVDHTHAVILSKPAWMWGAEMGANEHGVVIGNEAVWTKLDGPADGEERLLGMDLLRLGLERADTAKAALDVITSLLEEHGQGGPCTEEAEGAMTYQNGFLIVDSTEAWVLETASRMWAAERVTSGVRNISNQLTIRTKIDLMSADLKEHAQKQGWWKPTDGEFDFAQAYSQCYEPTDLVRGHPPSSRLQWGLKLLQDYSEGGNFRASDMFRILRHEESGICMTGGFQSAASQVSVLPASSSSSSSASASAAAACHWFTATPDPTRSLFKPFIFCDATSSSVGEATRSPTYGADDPARMRPRFRRSVDRRHPLWKAHERLLQWVREGASKGALVIEQMHMMEAHCVDDMDDVMSNLDERAKARVAGIFQHMVELEMNFYK